MKIEETYCTADESGEIVVPADILEAMDISPGDEIHIAYFTDSHDVRNVFKELMLTHGRLTDAVLEETGSNVDGEFTISGDLLAAANIPLDADIEITCVDGAVIISEASAFHVPDELAGLLDALGFPAENVKITFNTKEASKNVD